MKKILFSALFSIIAAISLCSFTVERTFTNEDYGQKFFLYRDGSCVVTSSNGGRGTGTYDIQGSTIYIKWDNGATQQGKYRDGGSNGTTTISVEGVTYKAERRVVNRPRR